MLFGRLRLCNVTVAPKCVTPPPPPHTALCRCVLDVLSDLNLAPNKSVLKTNTALIR